MSDTHQEIKTRYLNWAEFEGSGRCEVYVDLAQWVAESDTAQAFIASFEAVKRQPNLVFAALRKAYGVPMSRRELEAALMAHAEAIGAIIETHRTQTNEAARCAGLLLGLAQIDGPISLIEVGASAGLCMIPDYYSYRFGDTSGLSIGHVSPEAAEGGTIALVEDGDTITIDIQNRKLELEVTPEALDRRRAELDKKFGKHWAPARPRQRHIKSPARLCAFCHQCLRRRSAQSLKGWRALIL